MSELSGRMRLSQLAGMQFGGERDLYDVLGYPRVLQPGDFVDAYNRGDIAARILDAYPDATWREAPAVKGAEAFVAAWRHVEKRFGLWETFHRLDRLTGMGHYGVLLLGLDGGEPTHLPANRKDYGLLYLQPHGERTAQISAWEEDPRSPRYGRPKMYRITTGVNWTGTGGGQRVLSVHHSRVIHVAERALEDVSIGTPRLERIWNRLMDLDKLLGGSAEIYWQNAAMLLAFVADAEAEWDPQERKDMQEQLEELQHGLRRMLRLRGVDPKQLAPGLMGSDPANHIDKQLDIIAGASGIPKRILLGSESGELASSQDENNWAGRVAERREQFAGPAVVETFITAGQRLGFLPEGYEACTWPEADTMGEAGRAEIGLKKSQALQAYMNTPGAELVVSPREFRGWLGEKGDAPEMPTESSLDEDSSEVVVQFRRHKA